MCYRLVLLDRPLTKIAWAGFFLGVVFLIYGNSLSHEFVYDDHWTIVENASIQSATPWYRFWLDRETVAHPSSGMGQDIVSDLIK